MLAFIRIIRPINCLIMGIAVLIGIAVAVQNGHGKLLEANLMFKMLLGFTTGFVFLAAANVINDYYDREIDKINEPTRPIPSGLVTPNEALGYVAILSAVGFATALLINTSSLLVAIIAWFLFIYYATRGKHTGLIGNFIVSVCIAIPFIYGGFVFGTMLPQLSMFFAGMAFLSTVAREVTKGIVDAQGDKLQNVKTIAVLYGERKAAVVAVVFYVIAIIFSALPISFNKVSIWYLPFVVVADFGFLFSSVSLIHNYSRDNARKVKKYARIWMVIGLFAFLVGALG